MLRNDYRRALIMLRAIERDYAGHARLERRTLIGSLCFTASAPGAARLRAALVGRRGNEYYAAPLGEMRRDSRGQYGLIASFDPRNIEGRELEAYQLATITDSANGECRLVLTGNVNGSVEMDWGRVRNAVCALWDAPDSAEAAQSPADRQDDAPGAQAQTQGDANGAEADPEVPLTAPAAWELPASDTGAAQPVPSGNSAQTDGASTPAAWTLPASDAGTAGAPAEASLPHQGGEGAFPDTLGQAVALETVQPQGATLDISQPWPAAFETVRALFADGEAMDDPPVAGYVFVREPLPEGAGYPYVAIGVRVEDGAPTQLVYAFPAERTSEPPAGLEDCVWVGGERQGWWLRAGAR